MVQLHQLRYNNCKPRKYGDGPLGLQVAIHLQSGVKLTVYGLEMEKKLRVSEPIPSSRFTHNNTPVRPLWLLQFWMESWNLKWIVNAIPKSIARIRYKQPSTSQPIINPFHNMQNKVGWRIRIRKVRFPKLNLHRELEAFAGIYLIRSLSFWLILAVDPSWRLWSIKFVIFDLFCTLLTFSDNCARLTFFHFHDSVGDCTYYFRYLMLVIIQQPKKFGNL